MAIDTSQHATRGIWLSIIYDYAKQNNFIDKTGQTALEDRFGSSGISSTKTYTIEDVEYFYHKVVYKHIFARNPKTPYFEIGYENYTAYSKTPVGKTSLVLFKKDWRLYALSCSPVINAMTKGMVIKSTREKDTSVFTHITLCPYPIGYFGGIFKAALVSMTNDAFLTWQVQGEGDYRYHFVPTENGQKYDPTQGTLAPEYTPGKK